MAVLNLCQVMVLKSGFQKMEEGAGRSARRVLPWHEKRSEYLEGTTKEMEMVMFD
jgi:hypothetical protein